MLSLDDSIIFKLLNLEIVNELFCAPKSKLYLEGDGHVGRFDVGDGAEELRHLRIQFRRPLLPAVQEDGEGYQLSQSTGAAHLKSIKKQNRTSNHFLLFKKFKKGFELIT